MSEYEAALLQKQMDDAIYEYYMAKWETPKLHGLIERKWNEVQRLQRKINALQDKMSEQANGGRIDVD